MCNLPSVIHQWLVLDGSITPGWVDGLNTVLDETRKLTLPTAENIAVQGIETSSS